ncbi:MAG: acyloxyacyl hydrolase, partial [Proteobacteria bacterium]|nr:acyloxyacyl hydrolase [Pseudomonadota bacterium]
TVELGVSYWRARGEREPCCVWQLSAVPLLRWWPGSGRWFVEGGIGATLFSHTYFADRAISTAFQFGDMVGVGWQLTPDLRVGLRLAHFSNADIKRPNPGLNVVQLSLTHLY